MPDWISKFFKLIENDIQRIIFQFPAFVVNFLDVRFGAGRCDHFRADFFEPGKAFFRHSFRQNRNRCTIKQHRIERATSAIISSRWPNSFVDIRDSILLENVEIGRNCRIRKAIIDKDVYLPSGTIIGYDQKSDRERFIVSEGGVVVIPKGAEIR